MNEIVMNKIHKKVNGIWKDLDNETKVVADANIIKKRGEYAVTHLENKSLNELEELIRRQEKILANKKFVSKLPDQGKKLKSRLEEFKCAIYLMTEAESLLKESYENSVEALEWMKSGKRKVPVTKTNIISTNEIITCASNNLSDDDYDDSNPLELLANHSIDVSRRIYYNNDEDSLMSSVADELNNLHIQDKHNGEECGNSRSNLSLSGTFFSDILERKVEEVNKRSRKRNPFKTNRPLIERPPKEKDLKSPLWIECAETGCLVQKSITKSMPLSESLSRMDEAHKSLMGIWHHEAQEALGSMPLMRIGLPERDNTRYRDVNTDRHILDESDEEETYQPLAYVNNEEHDEFLEH